MQFSRTTLVQALYSIFVPSVGDIATPALFTILGSLGKLELGPDYTIYDFEESCNTVVPTEEFVQSYTTVEVLASWDGSAEFSWGYGSVELIKFDVGAPQQGLGLAIHVSGSPISSAVTLWVAPEDVSKMA